MAEECHCGIERTSHKVGSISPKQTIHLANYLPRVFYDNRRASKAQDTATTTLTASPSKRKRFRASSPEADSVDDDSRLSYPLGYQKSSRSNSASSRAIYPIPSP